MGIDRTIRFASVDELLLDPQNPRIGRANTRRTLPQAQILDIMKSWSLEELATSFIENGFWPQEALIVIREQVYGQPELVVVEGNRRLAALKYLQDVMNGERRDRKWRDLIEETPPQRDLFDAIPYIEVDDRADVDAFLGFRHVTGIKEWAPAEKAEYIAKLIEANGLTYEQVMRKIGSKTPTVRQNYISYRLLLQMEEEEDISLEEVEQKFSVLFLSLRTEGVRRYLQIDIQADPQDARYPVPDDRMEQLENFALWLFGNDRVPPVVRESRQVDDFGRILMSEQAVDYLERTERPKFDVAWQLAGGDEPEVVRLIEQAADNVSIALSRAHRYRKSENLEAASERLVTDVAQLITLFPDLRSIICGEPGK